MAGKHGGSTVKRDGCGHASRRKAALWNRVLCRNGEDIIGYYRVFTGFITYSHLTGKKFISTVPRPYFEIARRSLILYTKLCAGDWY
jgi:hypothetical protein